MRLKPMQMGRLIPSRAKRARLYDSTDKRTRIGWCAQHGRQTVMMVRGRWHFVCCGQKPAYTSPHPISVLVVPFLDNIMLNENQQAPN